MDIIPRDVKVLELFRYLSYEDIMELCQTNREFNMICHNNITWKYLLQRDFGITYTKENAYNLYMLYKQALDYFSNFYPIITQRVLNIIVNIAPISTWDSIAQAIGERNMEIIYKEYLLSVYILIEICNQEFLIEHELIVTEVNCETIKSNVNTQLIEELRKYCNRFWKLISYPTLVFINKKLTLIKYDLDLGHSLLLDTGNDCFKEYGQFKDYIRSLL
jgi:hypothetical protein